MNGATTETTNWVGVLFVIGFFFWAMVLLAELIVGTFLLFKVYKLTVKMELTAVQAAEDRAQATEDRLLTRQLLTIVKAWATVMESKENRKEEQIKQVAAAAEKTTEEVKAVVAQIPEQVRVLLTEKAGSH